MRSLRGSRDIASILDASDPTRHERWELPPQRQVNVRLDEETIEILEAAGFLDGRNLTDEARAAILARAEEARADPLVQAAWALRQKRLSEAAESTPTVSSLEERRSKARSQDV